VSTQDPRDQAIERLLRHGAGPGHVSAECLDAETLSAWVDGGLEGPSLQRAETHMADCARCQALMATLVNSADEPVPATADGEAAARPWWSFDVRWLMPLAGAATAVLLWMVVPDRDPGLRPSPKADAPAASRQASAAPGEMTVAAPPPSVAADEPVASGEQKLARAEPPTAGAEPDRLEEERAATPTAKSNEAARKEAAVDSLAKAERRDTEEAVGLRAAAPSPVPAAAPPAAEQAARSGAQIAPTAPAAGATASALADSTGRATGARTGTGAILSGDPAVRWRLAGPGAVERSLDAGTSWERLVTGVTASFRAGSAPSASVCWLVGENGAVLLTTDARTWRRLSAPTSEDLVGVEAASERTATVRTVSGQSFHTTDAGVSWARVP
jgi:hypothetical protein